jgi:hypothetical protein
MADQLKTEEACYSALALTLKRIVEGVYNIKQRNKEKGLNVGPSEDTLKLSIDLLKAANSEFSETCLREFVEHSASNWHFIYERKDQFFLDDNTMFTKVSKSNMQEITGLRELFKHREALTVADKEGFFKSCISLTNICKRWWQLESKRIKELLPNLEKHDTKKYHEVKQHYERFNNIKELLEPLQVNK